MKNYIKNIFSQKDKIKHILVSFILCFLQCMIYLLITKYIFVSIFLSSYLTIFVGYLKEFRDKMTKKGTEDINDIYANFIGISLAIFTFSISLFILFYVQTK